MRHPFPVDAARGIRVAPLLACVAACAGLIFTSPSPAAAQMVMNSVDHLSFDRPESWALKYFTAATLLGGLDTPRTRVPGSVSIGLEGGWMPALSSAQQTVGYNGIESLDLNKAPFIPRPRVVVALPARLSLVVAGVPPIPMFGLTAKLLAVALERPLYESPAMAIGLRVYGQVGTVRGAYTCPPKTLAFEAGAAGNLDGCQAVSSDTAALRYAGAEGSFAYRPDGMNRFSPHAAFGLTYMSVGFQVNALTFGMIDHTHYLSHGVTVSASAGVSYRISSRFGIGTDIFYSPLPVTRGPGAPTQNDGLLNIRTLITYRVR
jgi:hypothetical protein